MRECLFFLSFKKHKKGNKTIRLKEERQAAVKAIRGEYEQMNDYIFDSLFGSIDEQVSDIKR